MKNYMVFRFIIFLFVNFFSIFIFIVHAGLEIELQNRRVFMGEGASHQFFESEDSDVAIQSEYQVPVIVESEQNGIIRRIRNTNWNYCKYFTLMSAWAVQIAGGVLMASSVYDFHQAHIVKGVHDNVDYVSYKESGLLSFKKGLLMTVCGSIFTVPHTLYTCYKCIKYDFYGSQEFTDI